LEKIAMGRWHFRSLTLVAGFLVLMAFSSAHAALGIDITFTPACNGYTVRGGSITTNRDNTGRGVEALVTVARDGSGRIIYENQAFYPVNQRVTLAVSDYVNWANVPQYNPIIMQVVSAGGNGQPQQLVYAVTGNCIDLPTFGDGSITLEDIAFTLLLTAIPVNAAPAYDANAAPPRPVNPSGAAQAQPGYAIVSTDNLYMRSGDGVAYTPVAILDGGTELIVLGSNGELTADLWWYVQVGSLRGWVSSQFLYLRGDLTGVPVTPVTGTIIPPTLYVGASNPIYNTPSVSGRGLCLIPGDHFYTVTARDSVLANWYRIEATCDGQPLYGWIQIDRGLLRNSAGVEIPVY
jgi:uncharacterized protein YraI